MTSNMTCHWHWTWRRALRAGHRRRGAAYFFFLGAAMLVVVIGLSAVTVMRIGLRTDQTAQDAAAARCYARSAIEIGFSMITLNPNWRMSLAGTNWLTKVPIGDGTMSLTATVQPDADGNMNNNPLVFVGTGMQGQAVHNIEVTLVALTGKGGMVIQDGSWKRKVN